MAWIFHFFDCLCIWGEGGAVEPFGIRRGHTDHTFRWDWPLELQPGQKGTLKPPPRFLLSLLIPAGPFLPPSALLPDSDFFPSAVSLPGLEPPGGPDLLDDGFPYETTSPALFTMLDMLPPAPPLASAVSGNGVAGATVGEPSGPEPMTLDSYQAPVPGDGGTASLVGSNMFPNQYREVGFGGGLLSPRPEAT